MTLAEVFESVEGAWDESGRLQWPQIATNNSGPFPVNFSSLSNLPNSTIRQMAEGYTIVHFSGGTYDEDPIDRVDELDGMFSIRDVQALTRLYDGSVELVIRVEAAPMIAAVLGLVFPGSVVNLDYVPYHPTPSDLNVFGDEAAELAGTWFYDRTVAMVNDSWPIAAATYLCTLWRMP